jgi:hypothetical protein
MDDSRLGDFLCKVRWSWTGSSGPPQRPSVVRERGIAVTAEVAIIAERFESAG